MHELRTRPISYLWHDRSTVRAPHVSEGHRGGLVLVEPEFGGVDKGNLFKGGYRNVHVISLSIESIFPPATQRDKKGEREGEREADSGLARWCGSPVRPCRWSSVSDRAVARRILCP